MEGIKHLLDAARPEDERLWSYWLLKFKKIRRVLWYASAGDDFRPFAFYFGANLKRWRDAKGVNLERPDLFIYSSLGLEHYDFLRASLFPKEDLRVFNDERTEVNLGPRARLRINRDLVKYVADPRKDPLKLGSNHDAWAAEVRFNSHTEGVEENFPLLYFKMESTNFLEEFILRLRVFEVEGLCAIREGCSVIQTIYDTGAPDFYRASGFKPRVVFVSNGQTKRLFKEKTRDSGVRILESWPYFRQGRVFVLGYEGQD
jgi:hypothetical protein